MLTCMNMQKQQKSEGSQEEMSKIFSLCKQNKSVRFILGRKSCWQQLFGFTEKESSPWAI